MASRGCPPRHHCPQFSVATHGDGTEDAARVTCHGAVTSAGSAAASRRSARGRGCDVRSAAAVSRCHPSLPPRPASHLATSSSINKSGQSKLGDQFTSCISPDCCRAFPACPLSGVRCLSAGKRVPGPGRQ